PAAARFTGSIQKRRCQRPRALKKRKLMQTSEHNGASSPVTVQPLTRRLSLRIRCARPEHAFGQGPENKITNIQLCSGLMSWQRAARLRRILVVVKRPLIGPSSLERGSAATRTVVRSISPDPGPDELTHISRINRR